MPDITPLDYEPRPAKPKRIGDDIAYILPMGIFLVLTGVSGKWPDVFPGIYLGKTILTAAALALLWRNFTPIRWNHWWLGLLLGIVGIFQWVGMQLLLQKYFSFFRPSGESFNPETYFHNAGMRDAFIAVRMIGAVLVVPVMEELFWRDFLWRQILAPNDFKLAAVGEWAARAFFGHRCCVLRRAWKLVADGHRLGSDDRSVARLHQEPGGVHHHACDDESVAGALCAAHS